MNIKLVIIFYNKCFNRKRSRQLNQIVQYIFLLSAGWSSCFATSFYKPNIDSNIENSSFSSSLPQILTKENNRHYTFNFNESDLDNQNHLIYFSESADSERDKLNIFKDISNFNIFPTLKESEKLTFVENSYFQKTILENQPQNNLIRNINIRKSDKYLEELGLTKRQELVVKIFEREYYPLILKELPFDIGTMHFEFVYIAISKNLSSKYISQIKQLYSETMCIYIANKLLAHNLISIDQFKVFNINNLEDTYSKNFQHLTPSQIFIMKELRVFADRYPERESLVCTVIERYINENSNNKKTVL